MSGKRVQIEKGYDEPFVIMLTADVVELMQRVKPTAVCVYLAILTHANRKQGNSAYPSTALIAREANVSRRTVVSAVKELADAGVLTVEHRSDPKKGQTSSLYRLLRLTDPCAKSAQAPTQELHTPSAESAPTPMQDLHTNQMNDEPNEGEPSGTRKRATQKAAPKTFLPDDFGISDRLVSWASEKGFTVPEMESQLERFTNNARMKQHKYADWDAAFQNWMHNARDWGHLDKANKPANVTQFQKSGRNPERWTAQDYADYARELERQGR